MDTDTDGVQDDTNDSVLIFSNCFRMSNIYSDAIDIVATVFKGVIHGYGLMEGEKENVCIKAHTYVIKANGFLRFLFHLGIRLIRVYGGDRRHIRNLIGVDSTIGFIISDVS